MLGIGKTFLSSGYVGCNSLMLVLLLTLIIEKPLVVLEMGHAHELYCSYEAEQQERSFLNCYMKININVALNVNNGHIIYNSKFNAWFGCRV
jgi:hypothetical protein